MYTGHSDEGDIFLGKKSDNINLHTFSTNVKKLQFYITHSFLRYKQKNDEIVVMINMCRSAKWRK